MMSSLLVGRETMKIHHFSSAEVDITAHFFDMVIGLPTHPTIFFWLVLSDEQMSKKLPLSPLNDEQMSNWLGVEHLPVFIWFGLVHPIKPWTYVHPRFFSITCRGSHWVDGATTWVDTSCANVLLNIEVFYGRSTCAKCQFGFLVKMKAKLNGFFLRIVLLFFFW